MKTTNKLALIVAALALTTASALSTTITIHETFTQTSGEAIEILFPTAVRPGEEFKGSFQLAKGGLYTISPLTIEADNILTATPEDWWRTTYDLTENVVFPIKLKNKAGNDDIEFVGLAIEPTGSPEDYARHFENTNFPGFAGREGQVWIDSHTLPTAGNGDFGWFGPGGIGEAPIPEPSVTILMLTSMFLLTSRRRRATV